MVGSFCARAGGAATSGTRAKARTAHREYINPSTCAHWCAPSSAGDRNPAAPVPSKAREPWLRQQGLIGAVADVINACIDRAGAGDLDPEWRVELAAIELAQHQGEVSALGVPGGLEVGSQLDLRRAVGAAGCELPAPASGFFEA